MELASIRALADRACDQIGRIVFGQTEVIEQLLVALLSEGHILLEGVPGTAKTLLARTFAACLSLRFARIQFTPDLLPSDILGSNLFNFQTSRFTLTQGPIFTDFLLADEINRTPPKTQAALLQGMQERAVTLDGVTHPLSEGFLVVATQNPIEQEGTYPLPEAQLDRFLFKLQIGYPARDIERQIVRTHGNQSAMPDLRAFTLEPLTDLDGLRAARALVRQLHISDDLVDYVVDLVRATREQPQLRYGASPRAASMLALAARALAALRGRDFAIPDDIKELYLPAMRHRVALSPSAEVEGTDVDQVLRHIVSSVPAPR